MDHGTCAQVLHANSGAYLQQRKGLVAAVVHYASALRVPQEVAHSAVTLMDRVMMSGVHMTDQFQTLFICSCLRLAALHENAALPSGLAVSSLTDFPGALLPLASSADHQSRLILMTCVIASICIAWLGVGSPASTGKTALQHAHDAPLLLLPLGPCIGISASLLRIIVLYGNVCQGLYTCKEAQRDLQSLCMSSSDWGWMQTAETALERMESNISAVLRNDMECIAAVHCLKVYCQRLGCDLADGDAVRRAVGCAFALATEALADMAVLQFPPSLTAAAILVAARRAQVRSDVSFLCLPWSL